MIIILINLFFIIYLARSLIKKSSLKLTKTSSKDNSFSSNSEKPLTTGSGRLSQSQPGSRSVSPLSWLNSCSSQVDGRISRVRRNSGIPVSAGRDSRSPRSMNNNFKPIDPKSIVNVSPNHGRSNCGLRTIEKLSQNQDLENVTKANNNPNFSRHRYSLEDQSDESDNSSICSDRSLSAHNINTASFKKTLRNLFEKISDNDNSVIRALSLRLLCELLVRHTSFFLEYNELTILRILEASKDSEKEVQRASEMAAATAAAVLPADQCLRILKPIITLRESQMNQAAIKMLSKVN